MISRIGEFNRPFPTGGSVRAVYTADQDAWLVVDGPVLREFSNKEGRFIVISTIMLGNAIALTVPVKNVLGFPIDSGEDMGGIPTNCEVCSGGQKKKWTQEDRVWPVYLIKFHNRWIKRGVPTTRAEMLFHGIGNKDFALPGGIGLSYDVQGEPYLFFMEDNDESSDFEIEDDEE